MNTTMDTIANHKQPLEAIRDIVLGPALEK